MNNRLLALMGFMALALPATAANAQGRPYVEATAATNQLTVNSDIGYGLKAGLETPFYGNTSMTFDVGAENFLKDTTLNANIGLTGRVFGPVDLYGQAGVLRNSGEFGYRLGGGLRLGLTRNTYVRAGIQRDDYGHGVDSTGAVVGLGLRF